MQVAPPCGVMDLLDWVHCIALCLLSRLGLLCLRFLCCPIVGAPPGSVKGEAANIVFQSEFSEAGTSLGAGFLSSTIFGWQDITDHDISCLGTILSGKSNYKNTQFLSSPSQKMPMAISRKPREVSKRNLIFGEKIWFLEREKKHLQIAILETCDLWDISSEWWRDMNWPKKTMTKTNTQTKTKTMRKANTLRELHQRAILETCDLWDIWSEWWGDMTWP